MLKTTWGGCSFPVAMEKKSHLVKKNKHLQHLLRFGEISDTDQPRKIPWNQTFRCHERKPGELPQLFCEAALPPQKKTDKKNDNCPNMEWIECMMSVSCNYLVLYSTILPYISWIQSASSQENPIISKVCVFSSLSKLASSHLGNRAPHGCFVFFQSWLRGESSVDRRRGECSDVPPRLYPNGFFKALKKTTEVCLAFVEPFCWKRNWWCFEVKKNQTIPTSETRWWTGTRGLGITEATTIAQDSVAINSTKTCSHIFPKHVRECAVMW